MAEASYTRSDETNGLHHRDFQQSTPSQEEAAAVVPASDPVVSTPALVPSGVSAVEAAKLGVASENVEGTGVSHVEVAHELGVSTITREQYEQAQRLDAQPDSPQDVDTGGLVKQQNTAEIEALDSDTFNTWGHPDEVPKELVKGLDNDELWKIIRRFDKHIYHVKATTDGRKRGLRPELEMDLANSQGEEFNPDRLRSNLERLYIGFGVGAVGLVKHIQRVRSWNEFNRTATWCAIYFTFWLFAQVGLLIVGLLILLMVYPASRNYIFPQAPVAMVSAASGGLQKPKAGDTLGSKDSLTGASEAHKGEAVENEAAAFIKGIASVITAVATAQSTKNTALDGAVPDFREVGAIVTEARNEALGGRNTHEDAAKAPVVDSISKIMQPPWVRLGLQALEDVCDNFERLANALEPTHPYPKYLPRLRLAAVLLPVALLFMLVKVQYMARGATFFIGIGFFSQPYMSKTWRWFNTKYPDWKNWLSLQDTLLKGVPSNNQLALALLRIGEQYNTPLPPPPQYIGQPPTRSLSPTIEEDLPPVNPDTAARDLSHDHEYAGDGHDMSADEDDSPEKMAAKQTKHRILGFLRSTARTTVSAVKNVDKLKAKMGRLEKIGSTHLEKREDVLRKKGYIDGPTMFSCKRNGQQGWALISNSATTPCLSWVKDNRLLPSADDMDPKFSIQLQDVVEVEKLGGLGFTSKLPVGGGLGIGLVDGVRLVKTDGERVTLRGVGRRDELFNRLIALSENRWHSF